MTRPAAWLVLLLAASPAACSRGGGSAQNTVRVYVDEDPKDPNNLKKVHIGTIAIAPSGRLRLSMEKEVATVSDRLRQAVDRLQERKTLKASREVEQEIGGRKVTAMEEYDVSPGDPVYRHALIETLQTDFGLDAR